MHSLHLFNTELYLLPERAVYLPDHQALLVADVHLGKPETFQRFGVPIPSQVNQDTLSRLAQLSDRTQARTLFILGDLFHSRVGLVDEVMDAWLKFLATTQLEAHLILGNHDRPLTERIFHRSLTCHTTPFPLAPWLLSHEPLATPTSPSICGHTHPCIRIGDRRDRLRLPCFYWEHQAQRLTLPAFGDFTGGYELPLSAQVTAYAIAETKVIPFGAPLAKNEQSGWG